MQDPSKARRPPVSDPVRIIQTSWPNIRVALYRRGDGLFQFFEEALPKDDDRASWEELNRSGLYSELESAEDAMIKYAAEIKAT